MTYNSSNSLGGGIYSQGSIELTGTNVTNNTATSFGGGIHTRKGINGTNVNVLDNRSLNRGGGGLSSNGPISLTHATISGNSSLTGGGGISSGDDLTLANSTVSNNRTAGDGGGLSVGGDTLTLDSTVISNNSATSSGGGFSMAGIVILEQSTVKNNISDDDGGGFASGRDVFVIESTISGNTASNRGGSFTIGVGEAIVVDSLLQNNQAIADPQSNDVLSEYADINFFRTGDLDFEASVRFNNGDSELFLVGDDVHILNNLALSGVDLRIHANNSVNALQLDSSVSTAGQNGGNIRIFAQGDINIRNLITSATNGSAGNIDVESSGGVIKNTNGASFGLVDASANGGNAGNVTLRSHHEMTIGKIFAESTGGWGGQVELASDRFIRLVGAGPSIFGGPSASISTAGSTGGGSIILRHGGGGLVPFIVGDASLNGSAARLTTGNSSIEQSIFARQEFLYNYVQGAIQILSTDSPQLTLPPAGSNPPLLTFYNQTPSQLFFQLIAERLGAMREIDYEQGEMLLYIPGESDPIIIPINNLPSVDIGYIDEQMEAEYEAYFREDFDAEIEGVSLASIRDMLTTIEQQTGTQPVVIYALSHPESSWLELLLITPRVDRVIRKQIPTANPVLLQRQVHHLNRSLRETRDDRYLAASQQLYDWLIRPIAPELQEYEVDTLLFIMSAGLRTVPLAALHDGQEFLIEQYSLGLMPSVSLTDSRYQPLDQATTLAMGIDDFANAPDLKDLPAVPEELAAIANHYPNTQQYRNEAFTFEVLQQQRQRQIEIVHLATHAQFQPTYIQFWEDKVSLDDLRSLGWYNDPQVELLVLSACETALGDLEAELGFAGLAVKLGVKSAVASLWPVSDRGTLTLMDGFYGQLANPRVTIKAEALRQAQLSLLGDDTYRHPYYWSGFTVVGSPW
ncbi:MAG: CHAT domain-containing protein [Cyanobacteria bacterium P01_G01_bin.54]